MRPRIVPHIALALASRSALSRERRILSLTTRVHRDNGLAAEWAQFHAEQPMSRFNVMRQLAAATRFRAPSALEPRTLVISSAGDEFTHPDCPRALAAHFRAPLAVHPEAGHDVATDDPAWLAAEIRRWVES